MTTCPMSVRPGAGCQPLTPRLHDELVAAARSGAGVAGVLREWGLRRGRYYRWLDIGRGRLTAWPDGCPIDDRDVERCARVVAAIDQARAEHRAAREVANGATETD